MYITGIRAQLTLVLPVHRRDAKRRTSLSQWSTFPYLPVFGYQPDISFPRDIAAGRQANRQANRLAIRNPLYARERTNKRATRTFVLRRRARLPLTWSFRQRSF